MSSCRLCFASNEPLSIQKTEQQNKSFQLSLLTWPAGSVIFALGVNLVVS